MRTEAALSRLDRPPLSVPGVTLPKMWRKVLVRTFAAIFYETDQDSESQYCRKLCESSVN